MPVKKTQQTQENCFLEASHKNDFYTAKKQIESKGYFIPPLKELVEARMCCPTFEDNPLVDSPEIKYSWTRDFSIYVPGEDGIYLSKSEKSPIIENDKPWFTRKGHMWPYEEDRYNEKSILLNEKNLSSLLEDALFVENPDSSLGIIRITIPTAQFGDNIVLNYLLGKETARNYGQFLKQLTGDENKFIHLELNNSKKPYARQLCLGNVFTTNNIISNKCRLNIEGVSVSDARMIGLKK